ncbi:MAG: outer membrane lipoprotein carrier protein LolA [Candidatus Sumerlaeia bacterium]|nr:outer membrane lipoprotein carrier protein LolA [Candidatus Sumerlaeia bacterium]
MKSLLVPFVLLLATWAAAQETAVVAQPTPEPPPNTPALAFLRKVEEANRETQTLYGRFTQVRENRMFAEEVHSKGQFWHSKPNKFRCDYEDPAPAQFFLVEGVGYFYSPENKQLDKFRLEGGKDAPINELLVGFGLKVEQILEVFTVHLPEDQGTDPTKMIIDFVSRDVDRTLNFQKITITFDTKALEPRKLVMEESEDIVRIELLEVRKNQPIPETTYATVFPDDVTINEL